MALHRKYPEGYTSKRGWIKLNTAPERSAEEVRLCACACGRKRISLRLLHAVQLAAGVDAEVIEEVDDEDDPKEAILTLLFDLHRKDLEAAAADNGAEAEAELAALRAELAPMKMSHLKKRALACDFDAEGGTKGRTATNPGRRSPP